MTPEPIADQTAEQSVLGAILLTPKTLDDVRDIINPGDFYRPAHATIYETMLDLAGRGEPVDPTTLLTALNTGGELARIGGAPYLHDLLAQVPTAANAGYYARIVAETAIRRRLSDAGVRIAQLASTPDGISTDDLVEVARAEVDATSKATADVTTLADVMDEYLEALERGETARIVAPTPWDELTHLLGGWRRGALYVVGARPGVGKALSLDTPIPTPTGWTTMGEVQVGDSILGLDGEPAQVTFATGIQHNRDCFEVEFSDGEVIVADAEHLWFTETRASRRASTPPNGVEPSRTSKFARDQRWKKEKPQVRTTVEIKDTLRVGSDDRLNHSIPLPEALELPEADLPVDPYVLGYWLGDGSSWHAHVTMSKGDVQHLTNYLDSIGYHWNAYPEQEVSSTWRVAISTQPIRRGGAVKDSLMMRLKGLGVIRNKHIPETYLRSSAAQRRALLAGLVDSDGTINQSGRVSIEVTNRRIAEGAAELARSLGYLVHVGIKKVHGRTPESSTCYRIGFVPHDAPSLLPRKAERLRGRSRRASRRYIVDVRPVQSVPVRCIQVDNDDHMFLAGKHMVPTHNTIVALQAALGLAEAGTVAFNTLEMSTQEIWARAVANKAEVALGRLNGTGEPPSPRDWDLIAKARAALNVDTLAIDDRSMVGPSQIRSHARSVARRGQLSAIVVDYLQLMQAPSNMRRGASQYEIVTALSRQMKLLAGELDVPVILLTQLNRNSATDNRAPSMHDIRDSGAIEQDSDVILLLHHGNPQSPDIDLLVAKNRHGVAGSVIPLERRGEYSKLVPRRWKASNPLNQ